MLKMFLLLLFMSLFSATISNTVSSGTLNPTIFTILRLFNVTTGKKDKRKGCPLFFNIDFPWPKIIHIRNPYALNQCGHLLWHFAIHQQTTAPQSGHTLLTQVRSMCSWTLPCVSSLVLSVLHLSQPSSALQHWTASPTKEGCHWQGGGENRQTWQLANLAWYP